LGVLERVAQVVEALPVGGAGPGVEDLAAVAQAADAEAGVARVGVGDEDRVVGADGDEVADVELAAGLAEERGEVAEAIGVLEAHLPAVVAEDPELAVALEARRALRRRVRRGRRRAAERRQRLASLRGVAGEPGALGAGQRVAEMTRGLV